MITNLLLGRAFLVLLINFFLKPEVLADFLRQVSLSNVIGSTTHSEMSVLTVLIAIYEILVLLSVIPMSIHAFERVNP